jgi:T5SS/PEP-CTERM-associated repeat protein
MLDVGYKGYGRLNVTDGGLVSNEDGYIGTFWSRGVATVSGNGSTWINSSALAVGGHHGYGTLNIVNGGAVADGVGSIASASYSTGTVSVNGRDSKWTNDSSLYVGVGDQSDGRMNIANGSFVGCNDGYIGYYPGSKGERFQVVHQLVALRWPEWQRQPVCHGRWNCRSDERLDWRNRVALGDRRWS